MQLELVRILIIHKQNAKVLILIKNVCNIQNDYYSYADKSLIILKNLY
jgi:hypothetical protein